MHIHELRRQLRHRFAIGDTLDYGVYTITRDDTHLVATSGSRRIAVRCVRHYDRAVDKLIEEMQAEPVEAAPAPPPVADAEPEPEALESLEWRKPRERHPTGYRGVYRNGQSRQNPFSACITVDKKTHYLGSHPTPKAAAMAYDAYVRQHGLRRRTNFDALNRRISKRGAAA